MSLVSLTFGSGKSQFSVKPAIAVINPWDKIKVDPTVENKVEVKKVCQFLGCEEVYVVGQITSGVVTGQMKGSSRDKTFEIVELESKYGHNVAKQGMTVGLLIKGIPKELVCRGDTLVFSICQQTN